VEVRREYDIGKFYQDALERASRDEQIVMILGGKLSSGGQILPMHSRVSSAWFEGDVAASTIAVGGFFM